MLAKTFLREGKNLITINSARILARTLVTILAGILTKIPVKIPAKIPVKIPAKILTKPSICVFVATAMLATLASPLARSAQAVELGVSGGYGIQGAAGGNFFQNVAPYIKGSLSFGKRVVLDLNGGVIFSNPELRFSNLSNTVAIEDKIKDVKRVDGNYLYTVGADIRIFVRKSGSRHNVYLGGGADWLPQLATYYPGVKVLTGYQLALLKKRSLKLRLGAEYYVYGVIPVNTLSLTAALGYRF